jgi:hypothetical protein
VEPLEAAHRVVLAQRLVCGEQLIAEAVTTLRFGI